MATERGPVAVELQPRAVELSPIARESPPTAVDSSPTANVPRPIATAFTALAVASLPMAIASLALASASPMAIARSAVASALVPTASDWVPLATVFTPQASESVPVASDWSFPLVTPSLSSSSTHSCGVAWAGAARKATLDSETADAITSDEALSFSFRSNLVIKVLPQGDRYDSVGQKKRTVVRTHSQGVTRWLTVNRLPAPLLMPNYA